MSVVNKMLQDLDNRQPNGSDANYVPPKSREYDGNTWLLYLWLGSPV